MNKSNDELMMETMYWWGIPTLFRCHHQTDPSKCDIALVGVPHSTGNGTTERDQHLGPRAVRHVSAGLRRVHQDFNLDPWVQSVSINTGKPSKLHKVYKLGQPLKKDLVQIWDKLSKNKISCSVWGAMNSKLKKNKYIDYYFPDPWNFRDSTWPENLI